jgi:phosphatidate cytidylyltransferase
MNCLKSDGGLSVSDDLWRQGRDDDFDDDWDDIDLGEPAFADDETVAELPRRQPSMFEREPEGPSLFGDRVPERADRTDPPIRFGDDPTGGLPHWSEPPTGEVPRLFGETDPTDDLDIWSSFAQSNAAPVWRDDRDQSEAPTMVDDLTSYGDTRLGALDESEAPGDPFFELDDPPPPPVKTPIRIGIDNTNDAPRPSNRRDSEDSSSASSSRPRPSAGSSGPGGPPRAPRQTTATASKGGVGGRDMPTAIALGLGLAALFVALLKFAGTTGLVGLVAVVLGLAGFEFFGKATERGYRPATIAGILACALMPLAAYMSGERGIVVVMFLAVVASVLTAISGDGIESGPLPNTAITLTGIAWIGMLGSFAGLILQYGEPVGTDTLTLVVIGVAANDIGALFIGSAAGRTPLREWISPNKTIEGFLGGAIMTVLALWLAKIANGEASVWTDVSDWLPLALVIIVLAPIGDLTESMFKRNLDIKDFGTLLPGHGGVLDRFDGFLFVLPGAYYVMQFVL